MTSAGPAVVRGLCVGAHEWLPSVDADTGQESARSAVRVLVAAVRRAETRGTRCGDRYVHGRDRVCRERRGPAVPLGGRGDALVAARGPLRWRATGVD